MGNLGGHDLPSLIAAFDKAATHDRPTCFICYTIKGYWLPFAGHKDNHAGLMTPAQMEGFRIAMGIRPGDRVATLAMNTARHMEVWYGVMGIGAVCHTLNPRLFVDQLCYIINHAEDQIIFTDLTFLPVLLENRAQMPSVTWGAWRLPSGRATAPGMMASQPKTPSASVEMRWNPVKPSLARAWPAAVRGWR